MRMLKITVPASSANLGAGFDALGLALTLYNRVWMEEADGCHIESADGVPIPTDETNLIYHTARVLYRRCRTAFPRAAYPTGKQHPHGQGAGQFIGLSGRGPSRGEHPARQPSRPGGRGRPRGRAGGPSRQRGSRAARRPGHRRYGRRTGSTPSAYRCRNASASLFSSRISS